MNPNHKIKKEDKIFIFMKKAALMHEVNGEVTATALKLKISSE